MSRAATVFNPSSSQFGWKEWFMNLAPSEHRMYSPSSLRYVHASICARSLAGNAAISAWVSAQSALGSNSQMVVPRGMGAAAKTPQPWMLLRETYVGTRNMPFPGRGGDHGRPDAAG